MGISVIDPYEVRHSYVTTQIGRRPQISRSQHSNTDHSSYEQLSELEDVPCGYTLREITRLTTTHKYYNKVSVLAGMLHSLSRSLLLWLSVEL